MDKTVSYIKFDNNNNINKKYKIKAISNNLIYIKKSEINYYLPKLYYLVLYNSFLEKENIWRPASVIQFFRSLLAYFIEII